LSLSSFAGKLVGIQFSLHISHFIFGALVQGIGVLMETHVVITLLGFDDVSLGDAQ